MSTEIIVGIVVFSITYLVIIFEKLDRTAAAIFGAILMLILNVQTQERAFEHIDLNTILLLIGMMIIINITKRTGIFAYTAIRVAKLAKGDPWRIMLLFCILTGVFSALLDNVTTILLVVPVTLVIAETLRISPIPFVLAEVLFANIGGSATLIGDPPNIMIGSATGLGFNDFLVNLSPGVLVIGIVALFALKLFYGKHLVCDVKHQKNILKMDENLAVKDKTLLRKSIFVLLLTLVGFVLHQPLGYESATIALFGAGLLLVISKIEPEEILHDVEWPTIFFFAGLFMLVGTLEDLGVIKFLALKLIDLTQNNLLLTAVIILWGSAILSAFIDNIPFVATMIPLIKEMGASGSVDIGPLWWALALGACLGGNGTIIGASANVIGVGLLNKHGYKVTFKDFIKIGFPMMLLTVSLATVYLVFFIL